MSLIHFDKNKKLKFNLRNTYSIKLPSIYNSKRMFIEKKTTIKMLKINTNNKNNNGLTKSIYCIYK